MRFAAAWACFRDRRPTKEIAHVSVAALEFASALLLELCLRRLPMVVCEPSLRFRRLKRLNLLASVARPKTVSWVNRLGTTFFRASGSLADSL
jgi:hypothetical protein